MRVILPLHGYINWNGGIDLIRLIVAALEHQTTGIPIDLSFAIPEPSPIKVLALSVLRRWRELGARHRGSSTGRASGLRKIMEEITARRVVIHCNDSASGVLNAAHRVRADIVFPTMFPLGSNHIKRIGYIFDFQHRHLPDLFSKRTRKNRDKRFRQIAHNSNSIVVNAQAVARDVTSYLGVPASQIFVMPFTPYAHPWWFDLDPVSTQSRYGIHQPYVMVCNHFWKHKDHATALRAFSILKQVHEFAGLQLVMTGDSVDHRNPEYFRELLSLCRETGITQSAHFIGLIPKRDQLALLRGSSALIQPTLFEGGPGGGSAYEAIGLGVPVIASDIPINHEIDQGNVRFFRAGDPTDLASKIFATLSLPNPRPDTNELIANSERNLRRMGNSIVNFLLQVQTASPP